MQDRSANAGWLGLNPDVEKANMMTEVMAWYDAGRWSATEAGDHI